MTQRLAKIEQDRAVMLAGISHDLRTPLARLRLEAELSVADPKARENIAADIEQLDAIINKFLDYARPGDMVLNPVSLNEMVHNCVATFRKRDDMAFKIAMEPGLLVLADPVEMQRILTNLIENSRRYGKSVTSGVAQVDISARYHEKWVLLRIRDHGCGVDPAQIKRLTTPFFRGEAARTAANGAGLGLAIVEKTLARMGGSFELTNASSGGLCANIQMQRAATPQSNSF
jgi:two-component system osmolarity sensor histidine kinase EnvZ